MRFFRLEWTMVASGDRPPVQKSRNQATGGGEADAGSPTSRRESVHTLGDCFKPSLYWILTDLLGLI